MQQKFWTVREALFPHKNIRSAEKSADLFCFIKVVAEARPTLLSLWFLYTAVDFDDGRWIGNLLGIGFGNFTIKDNF